MTLHCFRGTVVHLIVQGVLYKLSAVNNAVYNIKNSQARAVQGLLLDTVATMDGAVYTCIYELQV